MFLCGVVDNFPRWPWDYNRRYTKRPKLRQLYTRMSGAFFHKGISRLQAEILLTKAGDDGSFLVRDSESLTGAYVLCLLFQSKVHQYRVLPGPDSKLHVQSEGGAFMKGYNDLTELIGEYVKKGRDNGLAYSLVHPVPPDNLIDDESDEDDDDDFQEPVMSELPPPLEQKQSHLRQLEKVDLLMNFSKLNLARCDEGFTTMVKDYVEQGFQEDCQSISSGESDLPEFKKLLDKSTENLRRELDAFSLKLATLNELLTVHEYKSLSRDRQNGYDLGVSGMFDQMKRINADILAVQTKALETAQYASVPSEYEYLELPKQPEVGNGHIKSQSPFLSAQYMQYLPHSQFEVKKLSHRTHTKVTLTVDLQNGKYSVLKPHKGESDQKTIPHQKILHLIKSTSNKCSLDVIVEGKRKQTYIFNDPQQRENFCVLIRQMKTMHSTEEELEQISVFVGTWNMGETTPNQSLSSWLRCSGNGKSRERVMAMIPHDLYVIGTQESALTERDWVKMLKAGIKACVMVEMELVEVCTMWGIRLAILCKREHKPNINRIQRASVRTGIANALGNKGAVAISFYFQGTSFCFINAHLTSGDERVLRRNQNFRDIVKSLSASLGQKHLSQFDINNQFHHVFWLGDLNYRIDENVHVILQKIQGKDLTSLLERDQMKRVQRDKEAFGGFNEAEITFNPTYRLERNVLGYTYAWRKPKPTGDRINVPSWCDRVIWRSYPETFVENVAYGSSDKILSSDHRPVFSSFNVGIFSEFLQNRGSLTETTQIKIVLHSIEAEVKTVCKQSFLLEFHSSMLQEVCKSKPNRRLTDSLQNFYTTAVWETADLPELKPLFSDQDYLEEQHILVAILAKDDDQESYGQCVLPLKKMFEDKPQNFEYMLLHQGEDVGKLRGKMHVISQDSGRRSSSKKQYSLVTFDNEYNDPELVMADIPRNQELSFVPSGKPQGTGRPTSKPRNQPNQWEDNYETIEGSFLENKTSTIAAARRPPQPLPSQAKYNAGSQVMVPVYPRTMSGITQTTQTNRPPANLPRQISNQAPSAALPRQPNTKAPKQAPPPIPSKGFLPMNYTIPRKQDTVEQWLASLNLSLYESNFLTNGWESLLFLKDMSRDDLKTIGINVPEHQERIMSSIRQLHRV